jgi:hypothetical protein
MKIGEEICELKKHLVILRDELGNIATGATYKDALKHLLYRRISKRERKR